jgi:Transcription factor WhiB
MPKKINQFTKLLLQLETPVPCTNQPDLFDLEMYWRPQDREVLKIATSTAKEMCSRCPVKTQCLDTALNDKIDTMIWGGLTPDEREHLLVAAQRKSSRIDD